MATPREEFLMREIEKRDRIIKAFRGVKPSRTGVINPAPAQGRLSLDHFPVTHFAMTVGKQMPLPETLEDIADSIGREPALMLAEAMLNRTTGNRSWRSQIYIPQRAMADAHQLVQILGRALAEQLQETHANLIVEVPRCAEIQAAYREHVARQMLADGETPEAVAACGTVTLDRALEIKRGME